MRKRTYSSFSLSATVSNGRRQRQTPKCGIARRSTIVPLHITRTLTVTVIAGICTVPNIPLQSAAQACVFAGSGLCPAGPSLLRSRLLFQSTLPRSSIVLRMLVRPATLETGDSGMRRIAGTQMRFCFRLRLRFAALCRRLISPNLLFLDERHFLHCSRAYVNPLRARGCAELLERRCAFVLGCVCGSQFAMSSRSLRFFDTLVILTLCRFST